MEIVTGSERVSHQFVSPIGALGSSSKKAAKKSIEEPTEAAEFFDVLGETATGLLFTAS